MMYPSPYFPGTSSLGVESSPLRFRHDMSAPSMPRPPPMPMPGATPYAQPFFGNEFYPYLQQQQQEQQYPTGPVSLGTSFDGQGGVSQARAVPNHLDLQASPRGKQEGFGLLSPSAVTGSSMQVHAPSSPPSVDIPSMGMQAAATNLRAGQQNSHNDPGKTHHPPPVPAASVLITSSTGTVLEVTGGPGQQGTAMGGGGARKEAGSGGGGGELGNDEGNSMSSLPMSVPEDLR